MSGCDYGIIVNNGKLTVDNASKLITYANIAPFKVTDNSATPKAQKDVISLPGLPKGTLITSVAINGMTCWSFVPTGGTLGLTTDGENNLTGASTGLFTFAYTPPAEPTYTPGPHDKQATTDTIKDIAKNLEDGDKLTIKPTTQTNQ